MSDAEVTNAFARAGAARWVTVSARIRAPHASNRGAVYVFRQPASGWAGTLTETARLTTSDPGFFEQLGQSVAISGEGDAVLSAAPKADVGENTAQGRPICS